MNSEVNVDTEELKSSIKRNNIAKFVVVAVVIGVVYALVYSSTITAVTAFFIIAAAALISEAYNYWFSISVFIDKALTALRKRGKVT